MWMAAAKGVFGAAIRCHSAHRAFIRRDRMQITVPHRLSRDEVRERLRSKSGEILGHVPGGMAEVETSWPSEDRMDLAITAMGQVIQGNLEIEDDLVRISIDLPMMLGFLEPMISGTITEQGRKLLA